MFVKPGIINYPVLFSVLYLYINGLINYHVVVLD
jgi:hypothetical protein